jgi:predicted nucleotidyltransferase
MMRYVNRHAMTEVFAPLDLEQHASERARLLHEIEDDFLDHLTRLYKRTAYELSTQGWALPQIGNELGLSIATVKRLIAAHAAAERRISPVRAQRTPVSVLDIRSRVQRRSVTLSQQADPPGDADRRP